MENDLAVIYSSKEEEMRDIKFRVYDEGRMKYPGEYKENRFDNYFIDLNGQLRYYQNCYDGGFFDTDNAKLMQFTGLHDKNGKEIYEGDIVRDMEVYLTHQLYVKQGIEDIEKAEKYRCFGDVAVVEFCTEEIASCGCCYQEFVGTGFKAKKVDLTCCEVIGNIWEDSDLLNDSKNTETN